jgi:hypothetical protein
MENNFAGIRACRLVLPRSRGKIEKSFSPKLTDYFIQGVRKSIYFHFDQDNNEI